MPKWPASVHRIRLPDRVRRLWGPSPAPDHPLSEEERKPEPTRTDRAAREWEGVFGDTLRPGDDDQH